MKFKIIYHVGNEENFDTKFMTGKLSVNQEMLSISGPSPVDIKLSTFKSLEIFRIHGLGSTIEISIQEKKIFITIPHINIAGFYTKSNVIKTVKLFNLINKHYKFKNKANKTINADGKYFCN